EGRKGVLGGEQRTAAVGDVQRGAESLEEGVAHGRGSIRSSGAARSVDLTPELRGWARPVQARGSTRPDPRVRPRDCKLHVTCGHIEPPEITGKMRGQGPFGGSGHGTYNPRSDGCPAEPKKHRQKEDLHFSSARRGPSAAPGAAAAAARVEAGAGAPASGAAADGRDRRGARQHPHHGDV